MATINFDPQNIDQRLLHPDDNSLATLLDGFYHSFAIDSYLDQMEPIDNRITAIVIELDRLTSQLNDRLTEEERSDLEVLRLSIDDDFDLD